MVLVTGRAAFIGLHDSVREVGDTIATGDTGPGMEVGGSVGG